MRSSDIARLLTLSAIWGASFLFMRIIVPALGPLPTAFLRVVLGAVGLAAILMAMRVRWQFKGLLAASMALGVINSGIPFVMYCLAARVLPAGYSAILNATTPLMGAIIGALFFRERLTGAKALGVLLGLAGVAVLTRTGPVTLSGPVLMGALACLLATSCYGLAGYLTKRWITERGGLDARLVAFGSQLGASVVLLPFFAYISTTSGIPGPATGGVWAAMAALGLLCSAIAYMLFFRLIADLGPLRSLTVTFLIPPFGVLWGALFLDEAVTLAHLAGGCFIALAVWLVCKPPKAVPAPSRAAS
ncbi:EamA family transporter [Pandoraea nosoerga]|uniref:Multidrug DMT transporter permease n=1 Tax=Pandoraea nosoerga TaxID=2508296 RepID=A0A5E4VCI7_9BURK|nr:MULTISPECIES: DMT family transporter [Pandoraea]MBN4665989.1 EamA family transporter [Pandoraea nosoerga]MBN4676163.1 EamA family transporter [Pandoraea nosoerga]MBN4681239.1 EamA family transporter [Pandoraea nosoerga]MBN4745273.1 EamA family transporter [Pandoraea nosoerga]VVE10008.1 multidrug DMT transporter permease [Pandoraea nosoerga]